MQDQIERPCLEGHAVASPGTCGTRPSPPHSTRCLGHHRAPVHPGTAAAWEGVAPSCSPVADTDPVETLRTAAAPASR